MPVCITASRIMKTKEVSENCRKLLENEALMMVMELEIKTKYLEVKRERAVLSAS
jgi:hypothetical protein